MLGKKDGRARAHKVLARAGYGKGGARLASGGAASQHHDSLASHLEHMQAEVGGNMPIPRLDRKPRASGGKLTAKARNALSSKSFVFPAERKYPIEDKNHARNALARVSQHGDAEQKAKVRSAVHHKYPDI